MPPGTGTWMKALPYVATGMQGGGGRAQPRPGGGGELNEGESVETCSSI